MKQMWRLNVLALLLAGTVLTSGCDKAPVLAKGDLSPEFVLEDLHGQSLPFPKALAGNPVVIRFWADWCPSCRKEMKVLDAHYQQRKEKGLRVLAVNVGQDRATAQRFVDAQSLTFDVLLDGSSEVARRYGVNALPMTYLVDAGGKILGKIIGETDEKTLVSQLDRLTGTGSGSPPP
jgi:cytochrome c biogenesis protein CcmG/thiol:disulfide interchange protein DsbE